MSASHDVAVLGASLSFALVFWAAGELVIAAAAWL